MGAKLKILFVEDEAADRELLRRSIGELVELDEATTLESALMKMAEPKYDCVLLDLSLPDSDPGKTLGRLRAAHPGALTVVISGNEDPRVIAECVRQGAQGYLVKGRDDKTAEMVMERLNSAVLRSLVGKS